MTGPTAKLADGEHLVLVPDSDHLPLVLDMLRAHVPEPSFLLGPRVYLIARDRRHAALSELCVIAAREYLHVDLAKESPLRLPVDVQIAHEARMRIAKVRASRLYPAMHATFRRSGQREEAHGRLLAFGAELGSGAVATWQNAAFDTITGWGELERFRSDPDYPGEIACKTSSEDETPPQWLRLPADERLLLDHGLSDRAREVATTVRAAGAHHLGLLERAEEMGLES